MKQTRAAEGELPGEAGKRGRTEAAAEEEEEEEGGGGGGGARRARLAADAGGGGGGGGGEGEGEGEGEDAYAYCLCKIDKGGDMVQCESEDNCEHGEWFHLECVDLREVPEKWWCAKCAEGSAEGGVCAQQ